MIDPKIKNLVSNAGSELLDVLFPALKADYYREFTENRNMTPEKCKEYQLQFIMLEDLRKSLTRIRSSVSKQEAKDGQWINPICK